MNPTFDPKWLSDPTVFQVNRLPACSDHEIFATPAEAEEGRTTLVRSLDGVWQAHLALRPADAPDALLTDGSGDASLLPMAVPGEFQLQYPDWDAPQYVNTMYPWDGREDLRPPEVSETYNPTVTLVRRFPISEGDMACGRLVLTFGGVEAAVAVYLNGSFVGYSEDSFTPHRFDITPFARVGENRLCARVFKRCSASWIEDQDFWRFSGIHRSVTLTLEPGTHLADIFVHTPLTEGYTRAAVEAELTVDRPQGTVRVALRDPDGAPVGEETLPAAAHLRVSIPVPAPRLWSAESPALYTLTVTLTDASGQAAEVSRVMVGLRQFEMIDRIMCLNGRRIVFHGVNRHEFHWERGRAVPRETLEEDIRIIKGLNINAIRTCHYPNDSDLYRLCDRWGLYVIDETNIESHGSWARPDDGEDRVVPGDRAEWLPAVMDRGRSMLERDKNHPCILLWSCGNESFGGRDLFELSELFRRRDPSRLVHYEGVINDPRYPGTTDVHSRMYCRPADIEAYLQGDPDKPFINCEYTHAMGNSCGGMSLYSALEDKYPMYQGGFIWDYVDQGLRAMAPNGQPRLCYGGDWGDRPTDYEFIANGIVMADRRLSPKAQEVRYLFQEAEVCPETNGVTIRSRRVFAPIEGCELAWDILLDGLPHASGVAALPAIAPGERVFVPLPWVLPLGRGEVAATCHVRRRAAQGLLAAGTDVAVGQAVLGRADTPRPIDAPRPALLVGDYNIGARGSGLDALFGRKYRGLLSLKDGAGRETLLRQPMLSLFRAPTDNDNGNGDSVRQGIWHAVSRYSHVSEPEIDREASAVTYRYECPALPGVTLTARWEALPGALRVTLAFPGAADQPDLPALGLSFPLDPRLNRVRYYGLGPEENYRDRCEGALLGVYEYAVEDGWTRYIRPQESGSRMGVRYLTVTDETGHGVRIDQVDAPLEVSVCPWLPEELAAKAHPDELTGSCRTILDVAAFRKGVGGDDSWGAPVLPQYTFPSDRPYTLTFLLRGI